MANNKQLTQQRTLGNTLEDVGLRRTSTFTDRIRRGGLDVLANGPVDTTTAFGDPNFAFKRSNNSYSGTDCTVVITYNQHMLILGNLETFAYSIFKESNPVRTLGRVNPKQWCEGCIDENEYILTSSGIKTIKDIDVGDFILSYDSNNQEVFSKCINKFDNGVQSVYEVLLSNGSYMNLTSGHRVYTSDGWKIVNDLIKTDKLLIPVKYDFNCDDINIPDYYLKFLAYGIGDGVFGLYKNGKETRFSLTPGSGDVKVVSEIEDMCSEYDISYNKHFDRNCYNITINNCKHITHHQNREYIDFIKWTRTLDIYGKKSHNKIIPSSLLNMSDRQLKLFLSRLFTTDGCFTKNEHKYRIKYTSTSKKLIKQIELLLKRFGIFVNIYRQGPGMNIKAGIIGKHDVYNLVISSNYVYKFLTMIGIYGKEDKYTQYIGDMKDLLLYDIKDIKKIKEDLNIKPTQEPILYKKSRIKYKNIPSIIRDEILSRSVVPSLFKETTKWFNIKDIIKGPDTQVYDLEIEDNHCLFGSFLSHNSRTIAGSLVFVTFDEHPLYPLFQFMDDRYDKIHRFSSPLADEIPPFDMMLIFNNEYGANSVMRFYAVSLFEEGSVYSINDIYSECTMQWKALDMDPMIAAGEEDSWKRLLFEKQVEGKLVDGHFASMLKYRQRLEKQINDLTIEIDKLATASRGSVNTDVRSDRLRGRRQERQDSRQIMLKKESLRVSLIHELERIDKSINSYEKTKMTWDMNSSLQHMDQTTGRLAEEIVLEHEPSAARMRPLEGIQRSNPVKPRYGGPNTGR